VICRKAHYLEWSWSSLQFSYEPTISEMEPVLASGGCIGNGG